MHSALYVNHYYYAIIVSFDGVHKIGYTDGILTKAIYTQIMNKDAVKKNYQCQSCATYFDKANAGLCPACGSVNVVSTSAKTNHNATKSRWRIPVMIALWGVFLAEVYRQITP